MIGGIQATKDSPKVRNLFIISVVIIIIGLLMIGFAIILLKLVFSLRRKVLNLTVLPVRELTNIMSISQKRKRMPPLRELLPADHKIHPKKQLL